eukprot:UN11835
MLRYSGTNMKDQNALKFLKKNGKVDLETYSMESSDLSQILNNFCPDGSFGGILYHMAGCKTEKCFEFFQCFHQERSINKTKCDIPSKLQSTCERQKATSNQDSISGISSQNSKLSTPLY